MPTEFLQKAVMNPSPCCHVSVFIKGALMVVDTLRHSVNNHVAGTRVEGNDVINGAVLRYKGDVCNTADVLQRAPFLPASEQNKIRIRDEGGALPASRHVPRTKISHGHNARLLGNHGRLADLKRRSCTTRICGCLGIRQMINRLPMRADEVNGRNSKARP